MFTFKPYLQDPSNWTLDCTIRECFWLQAVKLSPHGNTIIIATREEALTSPDSH